MHLLDILRGMPIAKTLPLKDWSCVYVQHLLASNFRCVEFLESLGLERQRLLVFGKGYSTSQKALTSYFDGKYKVQDRPSDYIFSEPFDHAIIRQVEAGIRSLLDSGENQILFIDEGGIATRAAHNLRLEPPLHLVFTELTSRGTPHYPLVASKFPIVDVANSFLKKVVESQVIVDSMLECLGRELRRLNLAPIESTSVAIIGSGAIGSEISRQLSVRGVRAFRYDLQDERSDFSSVVGAIQNSSIVLSSTGGGHLGIGELLAADGPKVFVNCGSSDVEFNLWRVAKDAETASMSSFAFESPPWLGSAMLESPRSSIQFLRGGFPINFDGSPDPIPEEKIQLTRAALMGGALQSVREQFPGIYELDEALQRTLLESFDSYKPSEFSMT